MLLVHHHPTLMSSKTSHGTLNWLLVDRCLLGALCLIRARQVVLHLMRHGSPRISEREILNHRLCSHHPHIIKFKGVSPTCCCRCC